MPDKDNKRVQTSQNTTSTKRARRQELYMLMPPDRKEASLARQRVNKIAKKNRRVLENSDRGTLPILPSTEASTCFSEQAASVVKRSLLLGQTGSTSAAQHSEHTRISPSNINPYSSLTSPGNNNNYIFSRFVKQIQYNNTH